MALARRKPGAGLLHHTDRGVQYASGDYQRELTDRGITYSMATRTNCWDNAVVESFFKTLKVERVYHRRYQVRKDAKQDIFQWIEVFYSRQRHHSRLGYRSPAEFEAMQKVA